MPCEQIEHKLSILLQKHLRNFRLIKLARDLQEARTNGHVDIVGRKQRTSDPRAHLSLKDVVGTMHANKELQGIDKRLHIARGAREDGPLPLLPLTDGLCSREGREARYWRPLDNELDGAL